jgi:peptide/nickel transport system substrate-binding protein
MVCALLSLTVAACGSSNSSGGGGSTSALNISDEYGATWTCAFNPFVSADTPFGFGTVYEELVFMNDLKSGAPTPWLATHWVWSNGNKTLTMTIRQGVKWSDGQAFSAKDVLYTFNLLKKNAGLDLNSDWSVLSSVAASGSDNVVFNFKTAAVPYFYYIADQTPIVPEHIWSTIKDPVTYLDPHPVGTGPYLMSTCSGANIQYTKNSNYWQPGLPKVTTVNFPSYLSNTPANEDLRTSRDQWGSQFIPSISRTYIAADPVHHHYWFEPVSNVSVFFNLTDPILSNVAVRQAMAYAIDRKRVSVIGEYGYQPPANQTSIVKPTFATWYDGTQAAGYGNAYSYDPTKAISILEQAGFTRGSDGIFAKGSQKLAFTIINNGGYSDWVAAVNVIQANLKAVGIQLTPNNLSQTTWVNDVQNGHYQMAYESESGGPGPYYELRQLLYSPNSAPIGKPASTNYERYMNSKTDSLINDYAATTSVSMQHQIVAELQKVMLEDVPVIPVTEQVDWYQYDTQHFGGWVLPNNPYAQPSQYSYPDWGVVLLHLYPTS